MQIQHLHRLLVDFPEVAIEPPEAGQGAEFGGDADIRARRSVRHIMAQCITADRSPPPDHLSPCSAR